MKKTNTSLLFMCAGVSFFVGMAYAYYSPSMDPNMMSMEMDAPITSRARAARPINVIQEDIKKSEKQIANIEREMKNTRDTQRMTQLRNQLKQEQQRLTDLEQELETAQSR